MKINQKTFCILISCFIIFLILASCTISSRSSSNKLLNDDLESCIVQCQGQNYEQCLIQCQGHIPCVETCRGQQVQFCKKHCQQWCQKQLGPFDETQTVKEFILEQNKCFEKETDTFQWF